MPLDLSALEVKGKSSNSEKMNETLGLKDAAETSEKDSYFNRSVCQKCERRRGNSQTRIGYMKNLQVLFLFRLFLRIRMVFQ